ncbi:MAG: GNAT family N-acetyltransferase [Pseudomonadota bacterium]
MQQLVSLSQPPGIDDVVFDVVTSQGALATLREEWDALFEASAHARQMFQAHAWVSAWARHYLETDACGASSLHVVTGRRYGRLVLVAPLVFTQNRASRCLSFAGEPVSQYGDILIADGEDAVGLVDRALRAAQREVQADILLFRRVRADSNIADFLHANAAETFNARRAPYIDLAACDSTEDYAKRFSGRVRKQRRKRRRQLEAIAGPLSLVTLNPGPEASAAAKRTVRTKAETLAANGVVDATVCDPRFEAFFSDIARRDDACVRCLITTLKSGEEDVATEIAIQCQDGYAGHLAVYANDYRRYAPGFLQIDATVDALIEQRTAHYDLLPPGDAYKDDVADASIDVRDYAIGLNWRGRLYIRLVLQTLIPSARWLRDRAPSSIARVTQSVVRRFLNRQGGEPEKN